MQSKRKGCGTTVQQNGPNAHTVPGYTPYLDTGFSFHAAGSDEITCFPEEYTCSLPIADIAGIVAFELTAG